MTRAQFIDFLEELKVDFIKINEQWQNKTIDDYLEAMARYAEDIQGYMTIPDKISMLIILIGRLFQIL